jgi:hypothetical protein
MATDSAQHRTTTDPQPSRGFFARAGTGLRRFMCGLHGHDALLHFEQGRMSLQCVSCGYQTPGWDVNAEPARTVATAKPRMIQIPLVHRRAA